MFSKLDFSNVTLVTVDTVCHELTLLAINECTKHADFGDIKFFSNVDGLPNGQYIPNLASSIDRLTEFAIYELPSTIKTTHILFIHWDSWIIDPGMWTPLYLEYDYIGAPWWYTDGLNVGNSGFTIRSKALMEFIASNRETFPISTPEDVLLCRGYRPMLPQFKWAPESLATRFAFERSRPAIDSRHFGFHGMFNWPFVLSPDKLSERMSIARKIPHVMQSKDLAELDDIAKSRWFPVGNKLATGV